MILCLVFGLFYVNKLVKEAVGCVYVHQVCVHLVLEYVDNLFAFAFAHKAMVHMYADQLLVYSFDRQGSNNGAVNTAGKCQQDLFAADLFANCSNLLFYKYLGKFGGGYANHVVRALIGIHAELF